MLGADPSGAHIFRYDAGAGRPLSWPLSKEREHEIARMHGAVFIMQIGGALKSGQVHDGRSPDYDDWTLNGDIVLWYPVLNCAVEISSMGIRVDAPSLRQQLLASNQLDRLGLNFHQAVLAGQLPSSIGGGIGQSRLCMFLLRKAHIGEVQVSVWNEKTMKECEEETSRFCKKQKKGHLLKEGLTPFVRQGSKHLASLSSKLPEMNRRLVV